LENGTDVNKKTGKIDMITYEVDRVAVMILKKNGKWRTLKDLKNFSYGKKIGNKALKLILKRAKNAENIRMASSPTLIRSNFTF